MFDFRFYFALFLRRLPYVIIFTGAGAAVGLGLAMTLTPTYQAEARLVVESEQIPEALEKSTVRTAALEQIQIIQQRIKSRDTLLDMANRLNIYGEPGQSGAALRPDEIVKDLRERVVIRTSADTRRQRADSNVILVSVRFTASSAALAADVTNEVVTQIQEENRAMRTNVSGQTLEFFEQEVERLDQELSERGAEIVSFQEANREALPESLEFRRNQLLGIQERLLDIAREENELNDRRDALLTRFEQTGSVEPTEFGQQALSPEQRRLSELRQQYTRSVGVLSLDNPRVRVMEAEIEALEKLVTEQGAGASSGAASAQTSLFDLQMAEIEGELDFLLERKAQLESNMSDLQNSINATPANAIALDTLERDYNAIRSQYDRAVANRGRAETGDIIEALSKGERISLIEAATPPEDPISPDRPRLAMMGIAGGLFMAFAFIGMLELLNTSIRRSQDITRQLDITPFGTLPFIRTRRDRIRRRLILLVSLIIIVAAVFGSLWGVNEYFMPLDLLVEKVMDQLPDMGLSF